MPPRCLVVYYEQLQRDLPAELERIAAFLQCPPELTRAPRGLRTARTGYAYQPPAYRTYPRRRAACPQGATHCTHGARVPAWGVPSRPRTVVITPGLRRLPLPAPSLRLGATRRRGVAAQLPLLRAGGHASRLRLAQPRRRQARPPGQDLRGAVLPVVVQGGLGGRGGRARPRPGCEPRKKISIPLVGYQFVSK